MACIHIRMNTHVLSWQTLGMKILHVCGAIKHIHYPRIPLSSWLVSDPCVQRSFDSKHACIVLLHPSESLFCWTPYTTTWQHGCLQRLLNRSASIFECMRFNSLAKPCVYPASTCSDPFVHNYSDDLQVLRFLVVFLSAPRSQLRQVASLLLVLGLKS